MKSALLLLALAKFAFCSSFYGWSDGCNSGNDHGNCVCLTDAEAANFVANFTIIAAKQEGYEEITNYTLAENFTSTSDGVNFVDGIPLNTTMTRTRAELLEQEAKLPPIDSVTNLFIAHNCDTITWYFSFATTPLPTRGIAILFVNKQKKIYKSFREVNSAAVLWNIGKPECQSNFTVLQGSEGLKEVDSTCSTCLL